MNSIKVKYRVTITTNSEGLIQQYILRHDGALMAVIFDEKHEIIVRSVKDIIGIVSVDGVEK